MTKVKYVMSKSLDGVLTQKANKKETFTEEQIQDLAMCMDPDKGYSHFARKFAYTTSRTR